mmetsp:Transcript_6553/g.9566  ORF Transcript_6553/g.9566 Transcript_6553/m.9566 type:complete len:97 (+) Transcript_6553:154-444(+)
MNKMNERVTSHTEEPDMAKIAPTDEDTFKGEQKQGTEEQSAEEIVPIPKEDAENGARRSTAQKSCLRDIRPSESIIPAHSFRDGGTSTSQQVRSTS